MEMLHILLLLSNDFIHTCTAIQSLGETHIDLTDSAVPPPPDQMEQSHDPEAATRLVGRDGDVTEDVIAGIVEQGTSGSEEEGSEGEGGGGW